jgi:hypothetical protein
MYVTIFTLQDSASEWLIFEQSHDNATWYPILIPQKVLAMVAGKNAEYKVSVDMAWFRMRYINGAVATWTPFVVRIWWNTIPKNRGQYDKAWNQFARQPDLPTYSACSALFTPTGNTDVFDFYGVANREIQIQKIIVSGIATSWTLTNNWAIKKKSTANTGGTSSALTKVPLSSAYPASSSTIRSYTVSPTLGTAIGDIWREAVYIPTTAWINNNKLLELDFTGNTGMSPITLNGVAEWISLNLWAVTIAGLQLQVTVLYTESLYL